VKLLQSDTTRWLSAALFSFLVVGAAVLASLSRPEPPRDQPRAHLPGPTQHTDHGPLMAGNFADGPAVTRRCLECHEDSAREFMKTNHWTWEKESHVAWSERPVVTGKKQGFNNYCISAVGNFAYCSRCHAGYGFEDASFDFTQEERVDCLVCHERASGYVKAVAGYPAPGTDLGAAARSVARPTRANCGSCHFNGGGGNAVKHGDLDESLYHPSRELDVHMGGERLDCVDCHQTDHHRISGHALSVSPTRANAVACTDCHASQPHGRPRLDAHTESVACETCHIPSVARKEPTKTSWDWSQAGQDRPESPHEYLKIKGTFTYAQELTPEYAWYDGTARIYVKGERLDGSEPAELNLPGGARDKPGSKIHPFKVHRGKQARDAVYGHLINPQTTGPGGYWETFDWDSALRLGAAASGLEYSGQYDFVATVMYWPLSHMVAPSERALACVDCHRETGQGRLDWTALGYNGDPMYNREAR
jgi:octaheme c-type cytochrome (tetrathionate reductase family)